MKQFLEKLNLILLNLKKLKKYDARSFIGINLGSEDATIKEYLGVDGSPLIYIERNKIIPKFVKRRIYNHTSSSNHRDYEEFSRNVNSIPLIHHNMLCGLPFNDEEVSNIYSSHFFEHIKKEDAKQLLKECFRVLKKGGVIRITMPSIKSEIERIKNSITSYHNGDNEPIQKFITAPKIKNNDNFSFHRHIYDFKEFKQILEDIGFKNVTSSSFRKGDLPLVNKIEHRDIKNALFVEACK